MSFADSMQTMDEMNGDDIRINEIIRPLARKFRATLAALLTGEPKGRAYVDNPQIATGPTSQA